jgi:hypothetical protein
MIHCELCARQQGLGTGHICFQQNDSVPVIFVSFVVRQEAGDFQRVEVPHG